ncbi:MAG TPA: GNAT family N-acetyltransferase [Solirubrobacteraceae bacterium]|jgi:GNAT superfamily N-acetyltransferase|nr:GNAT family N-acetyltransferase [Solirubrobacteraceae bacterium]
MGSRAVRRVLRRVEPADNLDVLLAGTPSWPGAERVAVAFAAAIGTPSMQVVALERGGLVGYAHCLTAPVAEGRRASGHVWVDPGARGRRIGTRLWKQVLEVAQLAGLAGVRVAADLADRRSLAVAMHRGLVLGPVRRESLLELSTFPNELAEAAAARATAAKVRLVAFSGSDEEAWRDLYESFVTLHHATPDAAGGRQPPPLSSLRHGYSEPWQILLARRNEAIAGMTMAFARPDVVSRVVTFFTGVVETERGQGIATALKAEHARRLAATGWHELTTWNMESNRAILAANARLGFVPLTRMQALTYDFQTPLS